MFCRNCGTKIPDGAKFCPQCGTPSITSGSVNQTADSAGFDQGFTTPDAGEDYYQDNYSGSGYSQESFSSATDYTDDLNTTGYSGDSYGQDDFGGDTYGANPYQEDNYSANTGSRSSGASGSTRSSRQYGGDQYGSGSTGGNYSNSGYSTGYQAPFSGMAIAGFVLSLAAIFFNAFFLIPSILGIIFSGVGLGKCNKNGYRGKGLAIAGMVISIILLVIYVIAIIYVLSYAGSIYYLLRSFF